MTDGIRFNSTCPTSLRAYGTNYIETLRVQIHANCRIRRVYFSDRLYSEDELPAEFKLYLPVQQKQQQQLQQQQNSQQAVSAQQQQKEDNIMSSAGGEG